MHLVIGATGAGKSTVARALAAREGAVRLAVDEWMVALYFFERPADAGHEWYGPRVQRCQDLIMNVADHVLRTGTPVVLEIGMTQVAAREAFYGCIEARGHSLALHLVEAPAELRWARIEARNRDQGETFSFAVTRSMFEFVEAMWEPPGARELARYPGSVTHTAGAPP